VRGFLDDGLVGLFGRDDTLIAQVVDELLGLAGQDSPP